MLTPLISPDCMYWQKFPVNYFPARGKFDKKMIVVILSLKKYIFLYAFILFLLTISIHLIDHVLQLSLSGVLSQRAHHSAKLFGSDCTITVLVKQWERLLELCTLTDTNIVSMPWLFRFDTDASLLIFQVVWKEKHVSHQAKLFMWDFILGLLTENPADFCFTHHHGLVNI